MRLQSFCGETRAEIFEALKSGRPPEQGSFDEAVLRSAKAVGTQPQMGATVFSPQQIAFEFIYPNPQGAPIVFAVTIASPERIVFLPVPDWVVESIWQGEIDGSFVFESEVAGRLSALQAGLEPAANAVWFGKRAPKRRE